MYGTRCDGSVTIGSVLTVAWRFVLTLLGLGRRKLTIQFDGYRQQRPLLQRFGDDTILYDSWCPTYNGWGPTVYRTCWALTLLVDG